MKSEQKSEQMVLTSQDLATAARLASGTVRRLSFEHMRQRQGNPEHAARASEPGACCLMAYLQAMAQAQLDGAEGSLRRVESRTP